MQRPISQRLLSPPDLLILLLLGTVIYSIVAIGQEFRSDFHPITQIDLSIWALPRYTLLSAARGFTAYLISLIFTLVVGYAAAKSKFAERLIIPMLDILQSIPVLGFLPALTLALISLFPHTNTGLELVAVIMIFTGQVWNMVFAYYSSLKSIPTDLMEASTVIGLSPMQRLVKLELPFSAVNLAWNSLVSMAGGWFFLTVCEASKIGDREFRLPGVGSYMAVAIAEGDGKAMFFGVMAMIVLIVTMDVFLWRPILSWVRRFRVEEAMGGPAPEPLMRLLVRESRILRWIKVEVRRYVFKHRQPKPAPESVPEPEVRNTPSTQLQELWRNLARQRHHPRFLRGVQVTLVAGGVYAGAWGGWKLGSYLWEVSFSTWMLVLRNTLWTFLRVMLALLFSTLWAVPVGIWIGTSERRIRIAQPIVQILASFPAPMLYPLALSFFFALGIGFEWAAIFLMMLGVQWYVLFNVFAGALRIPRELTYVLNLMEVTRWERWKVLYLPSVFPSLVTGWMIAAGGAWNASIVAEYVSMKHSVHKATGLGSTIVSATESGDFHQLAASLTVMVAIVLLLNRLVWAPAYAMAQTRYRMDM
jgi:NitT/TauT family transport system permease protein